ncbi:hypothetical protein XELAEV_18024756mg [Xenopus laevis]|uniref:Uncharacterized protein n=1 Tax=Xenopus laevis TaxID=8355 RepID=A0A974D0L5_XENLA|nr:hypothetical protein XELAEV_18024756mg [Xenopus laevis]
MGGGVPASCSDLYPVYIVPHLALHLALPFPSSCYHALLLPYSPAFLSSCFPSLLPFCSHPLLLLQSPSAPVSFPYLI